MVDFLFARNDFFILKGKGGGGVLSSCDIKSDATIYQALAEILEEYHIQILRQYVMHNQI
jgi:hypothetical protein